MVRSIIFILVIFTREKRKKNTEKKLLFQHVTIDSNEIQKHPQNVLSVNEKNKENELKFSPININSR